MTLLRSFPSRDALSRPKQSVADLVALLGAAALLWLLVRLSHGVSVPFDEATAPSTVSTDPAELPYYAARSLLRMFRRAGTVPCVHVRVRHRGGSVAAC